MDIVAYPINIPALICILIMIAAIVIGFLKKWMLTYVFIIANLIIFVITSIFLLQIVGSEYPSGFAGLGFRAIYLTPQYWPQLYTLFTSMFIHGGFLHIMGNMLVFFFVGTALEERVGFKKFLAIYLISGVIAAIAQSIVHLFYQENYITLIGASGAIFGVMGALLYAYPRDEIVMPIPLGIIMIVRRVKVIYAVAIFAVIETVMVFLDIQDGTAHFAHIGGLIGGAMVAAIIIKQRKVKADTGSFQTVYYDSNLYQRPTNYDYIELEKLATDQTLKEMLGRIKKENVPQVKEIWLEHFLEKTKCPNCRNSLNHFDHKVWCEKCGFKTNY